MQVEVMLKSEIPERKMSKVKREAWNRLQGVIQGFLGNHKDPNYKIILPNLIKSYKNMGSCVSLKLHFFHSNLNFFQEKIGNISEEHSERFHQDIAITQK